MKSKLIFIFVSTVIIIGLFFSSCTTKKDSVRIVNEESFFSDFFIEDNKVYIKCELVIENLSSNEVKVEFVGNFEKDYENGLLKTSQLSGFKEDKSTKVFNLPQGRSRLEVYFIGEHAGNQQKYDRRLPPIEVIRK